MHRHPQPSLRWRKNHPVPAPAAPCCPPQTTSAENPDTTQPGFISDSWPQAAEGLTPRPARSPPPLSCSPHPLPPRTHTPSYGCLGSRPLSAPNAGASQLLSKANPAACDLDPIPFMFVPENRIYCFSLSLSFIHEEIFTLLDPCHHPIYIYICICIYRNIYTHACIHNEFNLLIYVCMCVFAYECIFIQTLIWDFPGGKESTC